MAGPVRLNSIEQPGFEPGEVARPGAGGADFSRVLTQAVSDVDRLQLEADHQANQVAQGKGNLHETALALEKADVAMRLLTRVRNKIVDAYQEVMRMSV